MSMPEGEGRNYGGKIVTPPTDRKPITEALTSAGYNTRTVVEHERQKTNPATATKQEA